MSDRGMKRYNDGYSQGGAPKRSRLGPDDIELRILVPSKAAGSIIGKGGSNIVRLRAEAKVTVPDCPGPERVLTIIASEEAALNVVKEILVNLPGPGSRKGVQNEADLRLLIHQSQAGCLIGKGGSKVRELREKTGTRVKIYPNCCPKSTERIIQVGGSDETVLDCLKEVLNLLKTAEIKGAETPYDPANCDEYYADEYGGFGSGNGAPPMMGSRGGGGGGGDYPSRGSASRDRYDRGFDSYSGDDEYDGIRAASLGSKPKPGGGPRSSTQVTIPKDLAGAIIGTGGARIRKVRIESNAEITIDEPLPGSSDRIITIKGTQDEIQLAQYLLQQCIIQNSSKGSRGRY